MIQRNKGFTLIELLVVIAIISLLSSVVLASLNAARSKGRDANRLSEVRELRTVIQSYFSDNGTVPSNAGCLSGWCCLGHGDAGTCWGPASGYHGSTALDNLLSPKYISKIPDDPLNDTSRMGDAFMYNVFFDAQGTFGILHWGTEKANPTSQDCAGGIVGTWGSLSLGGPGNNWCMLIVR